MLYKQYRAEIGGLGEDAEEDRTRGGEDAANIVAEARTGRTKQSRKQRGQRHREETKHPLTETHAGIERIGGAETPRSGEGQRHQNEVDTKESRQSATITETVRSPARGKIADHRSRNDAEERSGDDLRLIE